MRIGIDCRTILDPERGETAGIGHYVDALVRRLVDIGKDHRFVLFFDKHARAAVRHELADRPNVEVRTFPFHAFVSRIPLVQSHMVVSSLFARAKLDLLHGPANIVPIFHRGTFVVTVHDLAIYEHPEWFPVPFPGAQSFSTRLVVPSSIERAQRIIAVSKSTANDILLNFDVEDDRIDVIPEGVDPEPAMHGMDFPGHDAAIGRFGVERGKYVLFIGTMEPRKNIVRAARAFSAVVRAAAPRHDRLRFVIAGKRGWKWRSSVEAVEEENARIERETGVKDAILMAGHITSAEKRALLAHASVLLFPSLYEGFGLPILEGMSAGIPVVTSDVSSMPEVAGDAAILVSPMDTASIAEGLRKVLDDTELCASLSEKGRSRAAEFTWERAARETLATYRKALGQA